MIIVIIINFMQFHLVILGKPAAFPRLEAMIEGK